MEKIKVYEQEKITWFEMDETKIIKKFPKKNKAFRNLSESEIRVTKNGTYLINDHVNIYWACAKKIYQRLWRIISKNEADEIIAEQKFEIENEEIKSIEEFPKELEV